MRVMREPLWGASKQRIRDVGEGLAPEYDPELTVGLTYNLKMTHDLQSCHGKVR